MQKIENYFERHNLFPTEKLYSFIMQNASILGIRACPSGLQQNEMVKHYLGEYYAKMSIILGEYASTLLYEAIWNSYSHPDWFDHRHHQLNPERFGADYWALSACHTLKRLPLDGNMLSLCSGDGWYEYNFYRKRASHIDCIEIGNECFAHSIHHHNDPKITYYKGDVLKIPFGIDAYDVVSIRGAIEHFTREDQQSIFIKARAALKEGGYFCGDTVKKQASGEKMLEEHQCEWQDEEEMRTALLQSFDEVETFSYASHERTSLFWSCRK